MLREAAAAVTVAHTDGRDQLDPNCSPTRGLCRYRGGRCWWVGVPGWVKSA